MQSVAAEFTTHTAQNARYPVSRFEVNWSGSTWTDESANVIAHNGSLNLAETGTGELLTGGVTDTASVTLRNTRIATRHWQAGGDSTIRSIIAGAGGMHGINARLSLGFALASTQKTITSCADATPYVRVTATAHGYAIGDIVRIDGTLSYDGQYAVIDKTTNTFDITATYTATNTGTVRKCSFVRIYTGIIYRHSEASDQKTVTMELRDVGYKYVQERLSTTMSTDQRADVWIDTLADTLGITSSSLDTSPHTVAYCWLDDDAALDDMRQMAAAAGGRLYFDHSGVMRYEEPTHWLTTPHTSSQWTFDAGDFRSLPPNYDPLQLATEIVVEYAPRLRGELQEVYTLDEAKIIAPGSTVTFEARLAQPCISIIDPELETDYWLTSAGGHPMNQACTVAFTKYSQRVTVSVENTHTTQAAILTYFQIRGEPITGGPTKEHTQAVTTPAITHTRTRSVRGNPYHQGRTMAAGIASYLADRYGRLIPTWQLVGVPGVPQLELGDRVTFSDGRIVASERDGFTTGISWRFDESGFWQTLNLLDAEELYSGAPYFIVGSTPLGAGEAWH